MKKIDLDASYFTSAFAAAAIYAKKGVVEAVQITEDGLSNDEYEDKDVHFDIETGRYVIDTYVMRIIPIPGSGGGIRVAELEDTSFVKAGEWIVTNPKAWETDRQNNYPIPDEKFRRLYEPTDKPGIYRAKGMARIIRNVTGEAVEIMAPWGVPQNGDANCYFCAPYNRENPGDLAEGERYILSENDFAAYGLADEVLGEGWNK